MTGLNTELSYGWLRACDEAMTSLHIGVANLSDSYASAKEKLRALINLHITIATDPSVNGGYKLVPIETSEVQQLPVWQAERIDDYEIRVTSPFGESWRLRSADRNDSFNNFIWRWAESMVNEGEL